MPSLKSLKTRIKSVQSTQKITKAMKMVSASKLRHAREKLEAAKPYAQKMYEVLATVAKNTNNSGKSLLVGTGANQTHLLVMITTERGLCGALNSYVAKSLKSDAQKLLAEGKEVKILCIGKKGYEIIKREYNQYIIDVKVSSGSKRDIFDDAQAISLMLQDMFSKNDFDFCRVYYTAFQSAIAQVTESKQIVPLEVSQDEEQSCETYEYEPEEEDLLVELLPKNLSTQLFYMMLESEASEHGSRMTAMDNATRNSSDMIKRLNLQYNRTRQACITNELIEIISGAEAV